MNFLDYISVFKGCTALRPYIPIMDDIYKNFTTYKFRVPVTGAIILDESHDRVCYSQSSYLPCFAFSCEIVISLNSFLYSCVKYLLRVCLPERKNYKCVC